MRYVICCSLLFHAFPGVSVNLNLTRKGKKQKKGKFIIWECEKVKCLTYLYLKKL